jgi:hypothetical protein
LGLETRGATMLSNDATERGEPYFWAKFSISVSCRREGLHSATRWGSRCASISP